MTVTEIRESGFKVSNSSSTDQTQEGILKQLKQINGGGLAFSSCYWWQASSSLAFG
jgi:hypothetical protein